LYYRHHNPRGETARTILGWVTFHSKWLVKETRRIERKKEQVCALTAHYWLSVLSNVSSHGFGFAYSSLLARCLVQCLISWIWICCRRNIIQFHAVLNLGRPFLIRWLILNTAKNKHFRSDLSDHNRTVWMQYCTKSIFHHMCMQCNVKNKY
jgi:hypothetical protein